MPYIPTQPDEAELPIVSTGKDLQRQITSIEELWHRFYPENDYFVTKLAVTNPAAIGDIVGGANGGVKIDTLYMETVDPAMTTWAQPHDGTAFKANTDDLLRFEDAVRFPMKVVREPSTKQLSRWGFDKARALVVVIPASLLDAASITVKSGDTLVHDGRRYEVKEFTEDQPWLATTVKLFLVLNCEHWRAGA